MTALFVAPGFRAGYRFCTLLDIGTSDHMAVLQKGLPGDTLFVICFCMLHQRSKMLHSAESVDYRGFLPRFLAVQCIFEPNRTGPPSYI